MKSGSPDTVGEFNAVPGGWYSGTGLEYMPSEILYTFGSEYCDYLVQCKYAVFI